MFTAQDCIKEIETGMAEFGRYTYYDKGAHEVCDTDAFINKAKQIGMI